MGILISLLMGRGLSALAAKAIVYGVLTAIVGGALLGIRQHYINKGWNSHKAAVERQDNRAVDASKEVQKKTDQCTETSGFWDVISQGCKLQEEEK